MSQFKNLQKEICEIKEEVAEETPPQPCIPEQEKEESLLEVEESLLEVEIEEKEDSDVEVIIYEADEIYKDFKHLSKNFTKLVKNQQIHFLLNLKKLYFDEKPYYLLKESLKIKKFSLLLKTSIRKNFIRYQTKIKLKDVEEVKITFKKDKIKNIYIKSPCCDYIALRDITLLKNTDKNVVTYLKYFKENLITIRAGFERSNWIQLLLSLSNNRINEKSLLPPSLESCIDMSAFDSLEDKLLSESFSYGEFVQHILSHELDERTIGETYKEDLVQKLKNNSRYKKYDNLNKNVKGSASLIKKSTSLEIANNKAIKKVFVQNTKNSSDSLILKEVIDVLSEADSISEADFSNVAVSETFKKLAIEAAKNKLKFFTFEEVMKSLMKKVLSKIDPKGFEEIYSLFSGEIKNKITSELERRIPNFDTYGPVWELETKKDNNCDYSFEREEMVSTNKIDFKQLKELYIELMVEFSTIDFVDMLSDKVQELNFLKDLLSKKEDFLDLLTPEKLRETVVPKLPELPNFSSGGFDIVLEKIKDILIQKTIDFINSLLINTLIKILESLEQSIQDRINNEEEQGDTKNQFKSLIIDSICDANGNSEETEKDLLKTIGVPSDISDNLSSAIGSGTTAAEFNNALLNPEDLSNNLLYNKIIESTRDTNLQDYLNNVEDVKTIFYGISSFLTDEQLENLKNLPNQDVDFISDSICLTNEDRNKLSDLVGDRGVGSDNEGDISDLDAILDSLSDTPLSAVVDALGNALSEPEDPECYDEDSKLLDKIDNDVKKLLDDSSKSVFDSLNTCFQKDMIGKRVSFFDNILADSEGVRLRSGIFSHDRRVALDLLFPNAADTLEQHSDKFEDAGFFEKFLMRAFTEDTRVVDGEEQDIPKDEKPFPSNVFPETIGIHCKEQVEAAIEGIQFSLTTETFKNGRKKPDLRLEYRNISKIEGLDYDFGVNVLYKDFLYNGQYSRNLKFQIVKKNIDKTEEQEVNILDVKVSNDDSIEEYTDIINQIDSGEQITEPYRLFLFKKFLKQKGEIQATKEIYELLNNKISKIILEKLSDNPEGFQFGFVDDRITYEDLIYVDPDSNPDLPITWEYSHEEEEGILGRSATNHPRVKFLNPAKYGGKYTKPKVYIEEGDSEGWVSLFSKVVPEVDGAEPKRENYLFLGDIVKQVQKGQNSIPNDKRFNVDPDCVQEPAFNKLMNRVNKATLEGVVRSTIRTYVVDFVLRTIPLLTCLKIDFKNNYHSILSDFIVEKMKEEMEEQFEWPSNMRDSRYWYLFLDASVDLVFRMVKEGRIKENKDLFATLSEANEVSKNYIKPTEFDRKLLFRVSNYTITNGLITDVEYSTLLETKPSDKQKTIFILNSMFYNTYGEEYSRILSLKKDNSMSWTVFFRSFLNLKYIKKITREYDIYTSRTISKKVLSFLIQGEIEFYGNKLKESFGDPKVDNINDVLFGETGILLSDTPVSITRDRMINPLEGINIEQEKYDLAKQIGGFFVEYYYKFEKKEEGAEEVFVFEGIKSINEFKEFIENMNYKAANLTDYFGNAKIVDNKIEGSIGVKFGVRINYIPPTSVFVQNNSSKFEESRTLSLNAATVNVAGNSVTYNESRSFFTLASYERDVVDKRFEEININDPFLGEEIDCYIKELAKSKDLRFFFNKLLMTDKIPALLGIYYYDGFIESVGLAESERGEFIGSKGPWRERILKQTKEQLADMFESSYFSRERKIFKNNFDFFKRSRNRVRKNIMPNLRKNLDKSVKRKQLRKEISRPYDKFGNEQVSPLDGLLGD